MAVTSKKFTSRIIAKITNTKFVFIASIFLSFFPVVAILIHKIIVGYNINLFQSIPDYILVICSMIISTLVFVFEAHKIITTDTSMGYGVVLIIELLSSWVIYIGLMSVFITYKEGDELTFRFKCVSIGLGLLLEFVFLLITCLFSYDLKNKMKEVEIQRNETEIQREDEIKNIKKKLEGIEQLVKNAEFNNNKTLRIQKINEILKEG